MAEQEPATSLPSLLQRVLTEYPTGHHQEKFSNTSPLWQLQRDLREAFSQRTALLPPGLQVITSFGKGNWAYIPQVALMDTRETKRPSRGFYVVFLFAADGSGVHLSLNQGSGDLLFEKKTAAHRILRKRASLVRDMALPALGAAGFSGDAYDLKYKSPLTRAYAEGMVVGKAYPRDAIPDEPKLWRDLTLLLEAYRKLVPTARLRLDERR